MLLKDRPRLLQPAYALDSVLIELIFILGPLLTGLLTAVVSPQAALGVSAVSVIAGTLAFTALPPSRDWRPEREARGGPARRARLAGRAQPRAGLAARGRGHRDLRSLPAFADAEGSRELAGVLLAVWSLGSAGGGLIYGALPNRPPLDLVHLAVATLPLSFVPMAFAPSIAAMAFIVIPAGMFIAPLLATRNELVGRVAPAGAPARTSTPGRRVRRRDLGRRGARGRDRRGARLGGGVPDRRELRGRRRRARGRAPPHADRARDRLTRAPHAPRRAAPRANHRAGRTGNDRARDTVC